jgi:hypothetical protein
MKFLGELYQSFKHIAGFFIALVSVALAVAAFYFTPDSTVHVKYMIALFLVIFILLVAFFDLAFRMFQKNASPLPRVLRAIRPGPPHNDLIHRY